jgi:cyclomaltodextrinase
MEAMAHWVRDMGVDGFRVDVAWGVKKRRPEFWSEWRREMKRINADVLLLAEASAVDPYYFSNGFDLAYDWTRQLGHWAWAPAFEFPQEAGALLQDALTNGGNGYSKDALIMRFLNNNDTGIRFIDQHGAPLTKTAAAMQFTVPGIPAMFAGDEIGASYEPYSNLTPIRWKDQHNLRRHYERLIELKHTVPALNTREFELLETDSTSALAYIRPSSGGSDPVLVILNYGSTARVSLSRTPALDAVLGGSRLMRNLLTGRDVPLQLSGGSVSARMQAESALVLAPVSGT